MIKRTVAIENPGKLSVHLNQLQIKQEDRLVGQVPVEDIGVLVIDHPAVLYTHGCLTALLDNNTAVVFSGGNHHPSGLLLPLDSNNVQSERFRIQIEASAPLKKQLWKQTVQAKIRNQAQLLKIIGEEEGRLRDLARQVKSGDPENLEAQSARYYWKKLLGAEFKRERFGKPPNNLLNYGYMVLRAGVARALVSTGLLPTIGIHHCNRYNAYGLADDVMEPYRVFVDRAVHRINSEAEDCSELSKEIKKGLLEILACDVRFEDTASPLMVGLHRTTASLYRCFAGEEREIDYPGL
ncbi:type II CRISPR-associated endonuclease Cas1 [bacterium]|nr:type II CRISPR-associated endonuclease Cas1 [bacterium]